MCKPVFNKDYIQFFLEDIISEEYIYFICLRIIIIFYLLSIFNNYIYPKTYLLLTNKINIDTTYKMVMN